MRTYLLKLNLKLYNVIKYIRGVNGIFICAC